MKQYPYSSPRCPDKPYRIVEIHRLISGGEDGRTVVSLHPDVKDVIVCIQEYRRREPKKLFCIQQWQEGGKAPNDWSCYCVSIRYRFKGFT